MKQTSWNRLLGLAAAGALIAHFWPMAYWSGTTTLLLRVTAAFCSQLFFCRVVRKPGWKTLPLLLTGLFALWGGWLTILSSKGSYPVEYAVPLLACLAGWLVWAFTEKRSRDQWLAPARRTLGLALALSLTLIPAILVLVLYLGWPPVIGNLTAARAMNQYVAQVYPEWKAVDGWATYNLVDGGYHQNFSHRETEHSLSSNRSGSSISDENREAEYRREQGIDDVLRRLNAGDGYAMFWMSWSAGAPDFPYITLRLDLSDGPEVPVPDEEAMRERMAERSMEVYEAIFSLTPVHKFVVLYRHPGLDDASEPGLEWHRIEVDLGDGRPLTRDDIVNGKIRT